MRQDAAFRDYQISCLIRKYPGATVYGLVALAREEMSLFEWDYQIVRNAVNRLEKSGRVTSDYTTSGGVTRRKLHPARTTL